MPNFQKNSDGLLPVVVQDSRTKQVLMVGYMNEAAYQQTLAEKKVTFYSRSKQRLWTKGETSGNFLWLDEILEDCDQDALLAKVRPAGPVCHTGQDTCFQESNQDKLFFLNQLEGIIQDRLQNPSPNSYTNKLIQRGINKISQKVGEEAVEVVIEATNGRIDLLKEECADLLYHLLILLQYKQLSLDDVVEVLEKRHQAASTLSNTGS
ncbi:MAG TPA: bifunctional phosphoribosyl-AMP cyclohydrolase/phosphoribosyl-ATP diphosphatase [Microscillaceae bacterium]|jgi:phosphoribosyl-ATP pyrophosphohydrolase/phosphoribosyl-AMP cyclohydrolase|nr:bifunctional phosphoribosyl-AMP cyclohydrolase/phosphoribosyl-ATP diphosphatase [Microscillaceae bacterium]